MPRGRPSFTFASSSLLARKFGLRAAAFVLADLLLGFVVFSLSVLGILWYFAFGWIHLYEEYAAVGMSFGTVAQFQAATALVFVIPVFMGLVGFLAVCAAPLPPAVWRTARTARFARPGILPRIGHPKV